MPLNEQEWDAGSDTWLYFDKIYEFLKNKSPLGYNQNEIPGKAGVDELSVNLFSVLIYTDRYPHIQTQERGGVRYFRYKE